MADKKKIYYVSYEHIHGQNYIEYYYDYDEALKDYEQIVERADVCNYYNVMLTCNGEVLKSYEMIEEEDEEEGE